MEEDGKVQNKKYSMRGQLGRTSDKKEQGEGELGSYRPDPLLQGGKPPLFRNMESLKMMQNSQKEEFVRAKPSDSYKVGRNSKTRSNGVRDKQKSSQLSKVWRADM